MGIDLVPNRNEFMSYSITNHTDQYLECSYWRKLEICNDSEWYEFGGNPWILSSEMIEPDENDFYIAYEFLVESKNSD